MTTTDPDSPTEAAGSVGGPSPASRLFRQEALEHHLGASEEGDVLRLSPSWTRWSYWLLLAFVLSGLAYLIFGKAPVYERGPALLRVEGRRTLTTLQSGTVEAVAVKPGQLVTAGEVLVRFRSDEERTELRRIKHEAELQLLERLRDPGDYLVGRELRSLQAQRTLIQEKLEERLVRAPGAGVIGDVRVRPGQFLARGEVVLTLMPPEADYTVLGLFPGQARPRLVGVEELTLEIRGFPEAHVAARVDRVFDEAVGPSAARKYLGPEYEDSVPLSGPVVLVEGRLLSDTFQGWDGEYQLHDGMLVDARARVRTEPLLFRLLPGLRAIGRAGRV